MVTSVPGRQYKTRRSGKRPGPIKVASPATAPQSLYDGNVRAQGAFVDDMTQAMTHTLNVEIHRGDAALELIGRTDFRRAWRSLHQACPWSTAFQDAPFADTWYRVYREHFVPVVVTGFADAKLCGLLLLATSRDGALCHDGAQKAEYQVWLATDKRCAGTAL